MIFSTTYNPMIPDLRQKIHNLQPILHASQKCKNLYPHPPILAYRRNRNLNDLLVSRRLSQDTNIYSSTPIVNIDRHSNTCEECGQTFSSGRGKTIHFTKMHQTRKDPIPTGFSRCGDKRCNTCRLGTFGTTIPITSTGKTFHIIHKITCKSSNLIYCITCKKCLAQYIGETEQELHCRQRGHLADINKNQENLPYVSHFNRCGVENYTITGVEKVRQNDRDIRKSREKYYKKLFDVKMK